MDEETNIDKKQSSPQTELNLCELAENYTSRRKLLKDAGKFAAGAAAAFFGLSIFSKGQRAEGCPPPCNGGCDPCETCQPCNGCNAMCNTDPCNPECTVECFCEGCCPSECPNECPSECMGDCSNDTCPNDCTTDGCPTDSCPTDCPNDGCPNDSCPNDCPNDCPHDCGP